MKEIKKSNKHSFSVVLLITLALLLLTMTVNYFTDNHLENSKTIVFLGNENIPPIVYDNRGTAKGIAVDIAKELGKKIGYKIEVKAMNWEVAQNTVLLGGADALLQINSNTEREKKFDFSDELLESKFCAFIKSDNTSIRKPTDLENKTVGVEVGGYPSALLQKFDGIKVEEISDWKTGFLKVISGELDAIVVDRWIGEYELAQSRVKGIKILDHPIETQYSQIAVKKGNHELLTLINTGLKEIKSDGTMSNIITKWSDKRVVYFTQENLRNIILFSTISFIGLILIIVLYLGNKFRKLNKKLEFDVKQRTVELLETNKLLRKTNTELEKISMIDELTGIYNRRGFQSALKKSWKHCMDLAQPLAIIMMDIDHFKHFNDTYGHLVGDECLVKVAEVLKNVSELTGNLIARFGGEEFIAILTNTTEDSAAIVAEVMRKKIENFKFEDPIVDSTITISLGVAAVIPSDTVYPNDLINFADRALYQAKKDGRNKVVIHSSLQSSTL